MRVFELERGIERLQAERAQLDKESALACSGMHSAGMYQSRGKGKGRSSKVKAQGMTISNNAR